MKKVMSKRLLNNSEKDIIYLKTQPLLTLSFKNEGYEKLVSLSLVDLNSVGLKILYKQLDLARNYQVRYCSLKYIIHSIYNIYTLIYYHSILF